MTERDRKNFEQAYDMYSEPIFRYCYFKVSNRERAKELTQETFMKVWTYLTEGKEIANLRAFLYKVAHNLTINEVVRRKKHYSLDTMQEETGFDIEDSSENSPDKLEASLLFEKIKNLGDESSELLIMRFVEEMSIEEIASVLNVSNNVVSVRLHRALEKVRKLYS